MDEDKDELTGAEEQEQRDTGETNAEAHRAGEFAELRELIAEVMSEIAAMRDSLAKVIEVKNAQAIDNGAVIDDAADEPADIEVVDEMPAIAEERDYTFDD